MKTAKWVLLAGMVVLVLTVGCDKMMTSTNPQPGGARAALDPLGITYNPGGSWFLYFVETPSYAPGSEHLISIGQDDGATNSYVKIWKNATDDTLYAEFHTTGDWYIFEAHFDVGIHKDSLAHNKSGNLTPGKFKGQTKNSIPYPQTTLVAVPWTGPWGELYMAALCKVAQGAQDAYGEWYYWNWNTGCGGDRDRPPKDHYNLPKPPNYTVEMLFNYWNGYQPSWGDRSHWEVYLRGIGDQTAGFNVWNGGPWIGWCGRFNKQMAPQLRGVWMEVELFSCFDPNLPLAYVPPASDADGWHKVSYLINKYSGDNWVPHDSLAYYFNEICYYLLGQYGAVNPAWPDYVKAMAADADANGGGYMPSLPGDWYAVIPHPVQEPAFSFQPIFIEVDP